MVVKVGQPGPGRPEQARPPHPEALGLVRSESCTEGARPPQDLQPGLLSRFRHQSFLVLPVTQFMRLTQSSAVPAEPQEAGSELALYCVPCPTP